VGAASSRDKIAALPADGVCRRRKNFLEWRGSITRFAALALGLLLCILSGSGGACAAEAKPPKHAGTSPAAKARPCQASAAVSPAEAFLRLKREPDLLLVDVRGAADHTRLRIPGSLGLPLAFLESKRFLKGRPLILVGDGFQNAALVDACRRLRQTGLDAAILDGGVPAWSSKGYPLEGDRLALAALRRVSPQIVHREMESAAVTLLDFSREPRPETRSAFGSLVTFPAGLADSGSAARLKAAVAKAGCLDPLLVATESGEGYDALARQMQAAGVNAYFLEGGLAAYRRHVEGVALSWNSREARLRTVSECRPCGEKPAAAEKP
jgi:rhodanese-related sulfurtransferase